MVSLRVGRLQSTKARGKLIAGTAVIPCALGPAGFVRAKREGDGGTPVGTFRLMELRFRGDRLARPITHLPRRAHKPSDGWCDDPGSALYNRPVDRPFAASHETMWRTDALYDGVIVLDCNLSSPRRGRGSAIFFHVAAPNLTPTAGCVAVPRAALMRLLPRLSRRTRMVVG